MTIIQRRMMGREWNWIERCTGCDNETCENGEKVVSPLRWPAYELCLICDEMRVVGLVPAGYLAVKHRHTPGQWDRAEIDGWEEPELANDGGRDEDFG